MRAERMLAMVGAVLGSLAVTSVAMGQGVQPAAQQAALRASTTQATVAAQPAVARQQAQQARIAAPRAAIAPQGQAQAALLTPVVARTPQFGAGTPILPVAQTGGLSCVPYVRMATGMNISGDARMWWHNAAGAYARGQVPERGSVLAFMSSGGMARGHVAIVSRVVNPRTVQIDHANWAGPGIRRGSVMRGVTVVDVSDRNDWTSVRVQVGHGAENFGRTYPTHGFIYNRPAGSGLMMAGGAAMGEVAEAPSPHAALHLRFALETLAQ
jgi:surface antigen